MGSSLTPPAANVTTLTGPATITTVLLVGQGPAWPSQSVQAAAEAARDEAEAMASIALAQAAAASASAVSALASLNATIANGHIYSTTSAGLAAWPLAGSFFSVLSTDTGTLLILYENVGPGTAVERGRYASADMVAPISGALLTHLWTDANGVTLMSLGASAAGTAMELRLAGVDGPLTGAPAQIESTSAAALFSEQDVNGQTVFVLDSAARPQLLGIGDVLSRVSSAAAITAKEYESFGDTTKSSYFYDKAKSELAAPVFINTIGAFHNADASTSFCREPWILPLTETTFLLFFSQRNSYYVTGEEAQRMCVKTGTIDLPTRSVSYSATRVIYQPPAWSNPVPGGWAVNPAAFIVQSGPNIGRVVLIFNSLTSANFLLSDPSVEHFIMKCYSDDSGATWSVPAKFFGKEQVFDVLAGGTGGIPGAVPTARFGVITGTSNCMIRLASGAHAGRIVVAINPLHNLSAIWYQGAMYSDDEGVTWTRGTLFLQGAPHNYNESQIVDTNDGSILMLMRDDTTVGTVVALQKGQARSTDGGATFVYSGVNATARFQNCSAVLVNSSRAATAGFSKVVMGCSASAYYYRRDEFKVRMSYDNGNTFIAEAALFPTRQGIGYGCMVRTSGGMYLLAYETFNGLGEINKEDSVGVVVFNEAHLFSISTLST